MHLIGLIRNGACIRSRLSTHPEELDEPDVYGMCPLHHAAQIGNVVAARILLSAGSISMQIKDNFGYTPTAWALTCGHVEIIDIFGNIRPVRPRSATLNIVVKSETVEPAKQEIFELRSNKVNNKDWGPLIPSRRSSIDHGRTRGSSADRRRPRRRMRLLSMSKSDGRDD